MQQKYDPYNDTQEGERVEEGLIRIDLSSEPSGSEDPPPPPAEHDEAYQLGWYRQRLRPSKRTSC